MDRKSCYRYHIFLLRIIHKNRENTKKMDATRVQTVRTLVLTRRYANTYRGRRFNAPDETDGT